MAESNTNESVEPKRQQFGNRHLTDPKNVFAHNAWDNVSWDEEQEQEAKTKTDEQLQHPASKEDQDRFEAEADQFWDKFYNIHENKFFKDRQWLFTEFPELAPESYLKQNTDNTAKQTADTAEQPDSVTKDTSSDSRLGDAAKNEDTTCEANNTTQKKEATGNVETCATKDVPVENQDFPGQSSHYRIFEVGCGVGNTVFPILQANNDPRLMVYCCDFSSTAIQIVKQHNDYKEARCHAFVCDISEPDARVPVPEASLDVIILIFVLSAIHPDRHQAVISRLAGLLKPGGVILFRDYGRYDMAQLRFKKGRCLSENFYARGDGTRVYFFTPDELREMMTTAGLSEKQNHTDRRLQVNRGRQLKMYRVWIQCKYYKPKPAT